MSKDSKTLLVGIFEHLRVLRATVSELESVVEIEVDALRGSQTVDVDDSIHLSCCR